MRYSNLLVLFLLISSINIQSGPGLSPMPEDWATGDLVLTSGGVYEDKEAGYRGKWIITPDSPLLIDNVILGFDDIVNFNNSADVIMNNSDILIYDDLVINGSANLKIINTKILSYENMIVNGTGNIKIINSVIEVKNLILNSAGLILINTTITVSEKLSIAKDNVVIQDCKLIGMEYEIPVNSNNLLLNNTKVQSKLQLGSKNLFYFKPGLQNISISNNILEYDGRIHYSYFYMDQLVNITLSNNWFVTGGIGYNKAIFFNNSENINLINNTFQRYYYSGQWYEKTFYIENTENIIIQDNSIISFNNYFSNITNAKFVNNEFLMLTLSNITGSTLENNTVMNFVGSGLTNNKIIKNDFFKGPNQYLSYNSGNEFLGEILFEINNTSNYFSNNKFIGHGLNLHGNNNTIISNQFITNGELDPDESDNLHLLLVEGEDNNITSNSIDMCSKASMSVTGNNNIFDKNTLKVLVSMEYLLYVNGDYNLISNNNVYYINPVWYNNIGDNQYLNNQYYLNIRGGSIYFTQTFLIYHNSILAEERDIKFGIDVIFDYIELYINNTLYEVYDWTDVWEDETDDMYLMLIYLDEEIVIGEHELKLVAHGEYNDTVIHLNTLYCRRDSTSPKVAASYEIATYQYAADIEPIYFSIVDNSIGVYGIGIGNMDEPDDIEMVTVVNYTRNLGFYFTPPFKTKGDWFVVVVAIDSSDNEGGVGVLITIENDGDPPITSTSSTSMTESTSSTTLIATEDPTTEEMSISVAMIVLAMVAIQGRKKKRKLSQIIN